MRAQLLTHTNRHTYILRYICQPRFQSIRRTDAGCDYTRQAANAQTSHPAVEEASRQAGKSFS